MQIEARAAYPLIAPSYRTKPNPLLALEQRILTPRLPALRGRTVLDVGSGTGRWASFARAAGARVVAVDLCREMIAQSSCEMRVQADMMRLPVADGFADVAICSMAMGYASSVAQAFAELARVARRVILSDMHPEGLRSGWVRSFPTGQGRVEVRCNGYSVEDLQAQGFAREWFVEEEFGLEDQECFRRAGREDLFDRTKGIKAIFAASWRR